MAKGKKGIDAPFFDEVPVEFWDLKDLKKYIQTVGKRAQSRIASLKKAYGPGGSLAGRQSYVLDRFGDLSTKTKGLSEKALRLKVDQIQRVMSAKSSTVKGVKEIDAKRMATFKERHRNAKVEYTDSRGRVRQRALNKEEWERAMKIMGKIQAAEKGAKYDSNEQLYMAFKLATAKDTGKEIDERSETITADNFITESGDLLISSSDFFARADPAETTDFLALPDEDA